MELRCRGSGGLADTVLVVGGRGMDDGGGAGGLAADGGGTLAAIMGAIRGAGGLSMVGGARCTSGTGERVHGLLL